MPKNADPRVPLLLELMDEAFDHKAWHGPNLWGAVRGLDPAVAAWRPGPGRHNIHEVALHAAYWKYAVRRRLTGEKRGSFLYKGSNWFARPDQTDPALWRADVRLLRDEHDRLREAVARLKRSGLDRGRRGTGASAATGRQAARRLVYGIAAHDLYHAGQIRLLRRLCPFG